MEDIRLAIGLIGFVSVAAFGVTFRLMRGRSTRVQDLTAALIVVLIFIYVRTVWGQLWIVRYIPLPSVIVLSNWFPILLAALAAVVWLRLEPVRDRSDSSVSDPGASLRSVLRRLPVMLVLLAAAVYSLMYFIPSKAPECRDEWEYPRIPMIWPVCLQTTPFTCSAAAAATILNTLNIETTEQEMARLCLTKSGTTWLGLYHGLSTRLLGSGHRVEFFEGDLETLRDAAAGRPVILCCRLDPDDAERFPSYQQDGGWIPGTAHSVVYFGRLADYHVIGDPSRGYEVWTTQDLSMLWTGQALRTVNQSVPAARGYLKKGSDPLEGSKIAIRTAARRGSDPFFR
ncbi:MAG: hypothetical protein R3C59_14735 [Planctomycetaceae bacterium]